VDTTLSQVSVRIMIPSTIPSHRGITGSSRTTHARVSLNAKGFILTDRLLPDRITSGPRFALRDPLPFETSLLGVFAVGDVRSGSMKRVAAAVGEGSSAVRSVHDHLAAVTE
jgi:thioredoxin reductase